MTGLSSDDLANDPRVAEAKRLILEALADHQGRFGGPRPPAPGLKETYSELLRRFGDLRGGALYYPYLASGFGRGPLVELADGSVKYDFISGIGAHPFGHSHPALVAASFDAALAGTVMQGNLQQDASAVPLVQTLTGAANRGGAGLKHCFITTSGAMANENALKLIFHKNRPASRILAFERCFMGRTLALAQVTDNSAYRIGLPATLKVDYVPFYDCTRSGESTEAAIRALKGHLSRYPGEYAGMAFELVQGEGGFYPGERKFFAVLMEILHEAGAAVMIDEIQTFGRTPELFAFQHFGLDEYADVVTIGKLSQVCATLYREEFRPPSGLISQTFTASTSAIYAARVILNSLLSGGYFGPSGKILALHAHFEKRLRGIESRQPGRLEGPYGIGAMVVFTVFGGDLDATRKFLHALFEAGVIGFLAGKCPSRVRFLIPFGVVNLDEIDDVLEIVERVLEEVAPEFE